MLSEEQLRILREQAKVIADKYIPRSIEIKKRPSRTATDSKNTGKAPKLDFWVMPLP